METIFLNLTAGEGVTELRFVYCPAYADVCVSEWREA